MHLKLDIQTKNKAVNALTKFQVVILKIVVNRAETTMNFSIVVIIKILNLCSVFSADSEHVPIFLSSTDEY